MEDLTGGVLSLDHRYEVLKPAAYKGLAQRYRGVQHPFGLPVDIWVMDPVERLGIPAVASEAVTQRLEDIVRQASCLRSPHALKPLDYGEVQQGVPFFLTESARGPCLEDIVRHQGRLPLDGTLKVIEEVSLALDEAHKAGFGHLGVRTEHIWFEQTPSGAYARLGGFGCCLLKHEIGLIDAQAQMGGVWVDHLAPESFDSEESRHWRQSLTGTFRPGFDGEWAEQPVMQDSVDVSPSPIEPIAFDVFGLAVVAYRCLTGAHPYVHSDESSLAKQFKALSSAELVPPSSHGVEVSDAIWKVLRQGLSRDPGGRPSSALDFAQALRDAAGDEVEPEAVAAPVSSTSELAAVGIHDGPTLFEGLGSMESDEELDLDIDVELPRAAPSDDPMAFFEAPMARYLGAAAVLLLFTNLLTLMLLAGSGSAPTPVAATQDDVSWSVMGEDGQFEALEEPPAELNGDKDAVWRLYAPGVDPVELEWTPSEGKGLRITLDP